MHKLLHFYRAICYNEKVHCMVRPIPGRAAVGIFTPDHKEGFQTARKHDKEGARQRILSTCVRLFLEQGFSKTPPRQIIEEADVSVGTFYHIFESKSAVLTELTVFMFENQFGIAQQFIDPDASPAMLYAVETAIQLALVEQNENLRDIYVEAYTQPALLGMIQQRTAKVISRIFRPYLPDCEACDFYEMEIGTAALMRGYMARPCDMYFTLERKIQRFLTNEPPHLQGARRGAAGHPGRPPRPRFPRHRKPGHAAPLRPALHEVRLHAIRTQRGERGGGINPERPGTSAIGVKCPYCISFWPRYNIDISKRKRGG